MVRARYGDDHRDAEEPLISGFARSVSPVFVLGIPRSGTTLLLSLLDGHPELLVDVGESRFFNWFLKRARGRSFARKIEIADRYLLHCFNPEGVYYRNLLSHLDHETVRAEFLRAIRTTQGTNRDFLDSYFAALYAVCGHQESMRFWVEKTPGNEFFLGTIWRWWPNARFLHVVRDPRDVYASYISRDRKASRRVTGVGAFSFAWGMSVRAIEKYESRVGGAAYLVIRYEDIVGNLSREIGRIRDFLGIDDHPLLYVPTKGGGERQWHGNAASGEPVEAVSRAAVGKWRASLSQDDVAAIEELLSDQMGSAGYAPEAEGRAGFGRVGLLRLANWLRWLRFEVNRSDLGLRR